MDDWWILVDDWWILMDDWWILVDDWNRWMTGMLQPKLLRFVPLGQKNNGRPM